jgi:AAA family ATP:ADP antiporter
MRYAQSFMDAIGHDKHERLKFFLLSLSFFLVIGSYTLIKELRDSIFVAIVGREYVPIARILETFLLIPAIFFYAYLVDRLRRYQLLYVYTAFYGIVGFICASILGHSTIGLQNTDSSSTRLFGWFFYFFVEGFAPFVVSLFWAFANSVNSPETAKNNYAWMVSFSKVGGMMSAGFAWWLLGWQFADGTRMFSDVVNHQLLLCFFSCMLILVPAVIYFLMKKVPGRYLHGYEAVYQFEKEHEKKDEEGKIGLFAGLSMLVKHPYVFGIFGMLFFYEMINTILGYHRLGVIKSSATTVSDFSFKLFEQAFVLHLIGFLISVIGTRALLRYLGEEICLILIPLVTGGMLWYFILSSNILVYVLVKSFNYAFAQPVRESLYIPTVKEIKFKSKSWIDAFGAKLARGSGSGINMLTVFIGAGATFASSVFASIIFLWVLTAALLGRRYTKAIANNEVIGQE